MWYLRAKVLGVLRIGGGFENLFSIRRRTLSGYCSALGSSDGVRKMVLGEGAEGIVGELS